MPGEAHFEVLAKCRDLARGGEATDMRDMVPDVVDLPCLHQWLPLMRIVPQLTDGHRRGALLPRNRIVTGLLGREQILAEEQSELLQVLGELQATDRIDDGVRVQPQTDVRGHLLAELREGIEDLADVLVAIEGDGTVIEFGLTV